MGYDFTGGRIFDFCIDFSMGLTTVQRYCAACDTVTGTLTVDGWAARFGTASRGLGGMRPRLVPS